MTKIFFTAFILICFSVSNVSSNVGKFILETLFETSKDVAVRILSDQITGSGEADKIRYDVNEIRKQLDFAKKNNTISNEEYEYAKRSQEKILESIKYLDSSYDLQEKRLSSFELRLKLVEDILLSNYFSTKVGKDFSYSPRFKPSFNCQKSTTTAEKILCTHKGAAEADRRLGAAFRMTNKRISESDRHYLRRKQIAWIRERDSLCGADQVSFEFSDSKLRNILGTCIEIYTQKRVRWLNRF